MKLYKFYKDDCVPCKMLSKMLLDTRFPAGIDYIEVDVKNIDNFDLLQEYSITSVPVLAFENGNKLIGMKSKKEIEEFLNNA